MNYARKARIATLVVSLAVGVSEFAAPPAHVIKMPEPVRGRYVVVLKGVASAEASNVSDVLLRSVGGHKRFVFRNALVAFSADLNEEQATRLTYSPLVQSVEEVALVHVSDRQPLPSSNLLWHLDRIDQHYLPLDNVFDYCERGSDVYAYMVDTGINREHQEFLLLNGSTKVLNGTNVATDTFVRPGETQDFGTYPCGGWVDNYNGGHGTSTASIIGGNSLGVAKLVNLVPVKVLNCDALGTTENIISGLDWIKDSTNNPYRAHRPALISMSVFAYVTLPDATAMEDAIVSLMTDDPTTNWTGITVVCSANNQNTSTNPTTPPRMAHSNAANYPTSAHVISVGGSQENDTRWACPTFAGEPCATISYVDPTTQQTVTTNVGSNWGPTVDTWAPAHNIQSAHIACSTCTRTVYETRSGTSFAAPAVAGVVARMLEVEPTLTPDQVWSEIWRNNSWTGDSVVTNIIYRGGTLYCTPDFP